MTTAVPNATAFTYSGDGVTRAFSFPLRFLETGELVVTVIAANGDETVQVIGTNYAVSGAGNPAGGTVTFNTGQAPASGATVKISRRTAAKQTVDLEDLARVPGDTLEAQLDRLAMVLQDLDQRFAEVETTPGPPGLVAYLFGDGAPSSDLGSDSDIYQDRLTSDQYKKIAGTWVFQTNIKGDQGDKGDKGDPGDLEGFDPDAALLRIDALEDNFAPGDAKISFRRYASDPDGWLVVKSNRTIGNAASGAGVADAKTEALFAALWGDYDNTDLPILDSTGASSSRGVSAAADYAANKRLPLPNPMDRFVRLASGTRDAGLKEANQNKQHNHGATFAGDPLGNHSHNVVRNTRRGANGSETSSPGWDGGDVLLASSKSVATSSTSAGTPAGTVTIDNEGGGESRPDSFVFTCLIKL